LEQAKRAMEIAIETSKTQALQWLAEQELPS